MVNDTPKLFNLRGSSVPRASSTARGGGLMRPPSRLVSGRAPFQISTSVLPVTIRSR